MQFRSKLLISLCILCLSVINIHAQRRTRQELLKEAGRLATDAERLRGEANIKAGGDRNLMREAEKVAAQAFEKAIELWREAGDDNRLTAGVEELTRTYSVIGEYDRVLEILTAEAEYWRKRGKVAEQARTLYILGIRQSQMNRDAAAIETFEQVIAMSRSAGLRSLEANALNQQSFSFKRTGREKEAEAVSQTANKLWATPNSEPARLPEPLPPATIPAQWVDLPGAPAAAEYRVISGVSEAVLVNRSSKGIEMVSFGCVALEGDGKVRTLHGLIGQGLNHGGVRPGRYYQPFRSLNGPLNRWTDEKMSCEGAAKMTLIEAQFDDGSTWKANGASWVP